LFFVCVSLDWDPPELKTKIYTVSWQVWGELLNFAALVMLAIAIVTVNAVIALTSSLENHVRRYRIVFQNESRVRMLSESKRVDAAR
jgi:hypothetical protein